MNSLEHIIKNNERTLIVYNIFTFESKYLEINVSKFNDTCGTTGSVLKEHKKDTSTECCKTMPTAT